MEFVSGQDGGIGKWVCHATCFGACIKKKLLSHSYSGKQQEVYGVGPGQYDGISDTFYITVYVAVPPVLCWLCLCGEFLLKLLLVILLYYEAIFAVPDLVFILLCALLVCVQVLNKN